MDVCQAGGGLCRRCGRDAFRDHFPLLFGQRELERGRRQLVELGVLGRDGGWGGLRRGARRTVARDRGGGVRLRRADRGRLGLIGDRRLGLGGGGGGGGG